MHSLVTEMKKSEPPLDANHDVLVDWVLNAVENAREDTGRDQVGTFLLRMGIWKKSLGAKGDAKIFQSTYLRYEIVTKVERTKILAAIDSDISNEFPDGAPQHLSSGKAVIDFQRTLAGILNKWMVKKKESCYGKRLALPVTIARMGTSVDRWDQVDIRSLRNALPDPREFPKEFLDACQQFQIIRYLTFNIVALLGMVLIFQILGNMYALTHTYTHTLTHT